MISEINVTPLVDVMLVLLVVFIITAPLLSPQSLKVNLPRTQSVSGSAHVQYARLVVSAQGGLTLDGTPIADSALEAVLLAHASDPGYQLQIAVDQAVPYGRVAKLMALAQHAGVTRLAFVTLADNH